MRAGLALLAVAVGLAFLEHLTAATPLTLKVRPERFAFHGADIEIRIRVMVEPERGDRMLEVQVESDGGYSARSVRSVNEGISTQPSIWIRQPPAGKYVIAVALVQCARQGCGKLEVVARDQHELEIRGPFDGGEREE